VQNIMKKVRPELIALLAIACAVALRAALDPVLGGTQVWLTFWPAMFLTAWYGGIRGGIAASVGSVAVVLLWLAPSSYLAPASGAIGAAVFVVCGLGFSYLAGTARRAREVERRLREIAEAARRDERRHRESVVAYASALARAGSPEEVARVLVEEGAAALGADVSLFARRVDGDTVELVAQRGASAELVARHRFPITAARPLSAVLRGEGERFIETAAEIQAAFPELAELDAAGGAAAALPLVVDGRTLGAVALRFVRERRFSDDERALVRTLVAQAAQAFDRAQLFEGEQRGHHQKRALIDLAMLLAAAESVDDVAQAVVSGGMRAAAADTAMLYVLNESTQRFHLVAERGCAPEVVEQIRELAVDSDHGRALASERWVESAEQYAEVMPALASIPSSHPRAAAWWSVPLVVAGRVVGALAMGGYQPRRFSADERDFVRFFAQLCGQAVARAERAARLELERLRLARIFEASLIGAVFWDRGRIIRANDSFLRSIGYTREELTAGLVDWRALTPPEYAAADQAAIERLRECGHHEPYEKEHLHKDGHRVPVLVSSAAFFDDPHQGVTYVADLTEVKRAAEAANRAKDEFLAMLGHELRNPLAPITTALELIDLRGPANAGRALEILKRQVKHLTRMVDDLLDVSRIKAGKIQIARHEVDLHEIITHAIEMVSPLIEERRHRLTVDVAAASFVVDVDAARMEQVFANILANAAKYTDPEGRIEIAARAEGGEVVVDVSDSGIGIDPPLLRRIFDVFTQEPQSSERSRGGLGLGLAIARMLVDLHGGTMTAHSGGKGQGSRFIVRLPRVADGLSAAGDGRPASSAPTGRGARRVLVVDDNRDAAETLAMLIEQRGHTVRQAGDGPEALRILEELTPDVALLDLGLPVMDGYELARQIRKIPRLSGTRMVAVTGYGQPSDRDRSRAAGFDLHLVKPVQIEDVVRAIEGDAGTEGEAAAVSAAPRR
jgi:PAS domain S-box-containing protein